MKDTDPYRWAGHMAAETLVDRWVAWPHVFSPVAASLHAANYQAKTLASYLQTPEIHFKSCRNPKLLGGPFVDVAPARGGEIRALLDGIERDRRDDLELARALTEFQKTLEAEAKGQSINPYYEKIPAPLGGYVELVYDYFSRPHVRCLESLFYAGPHYRESAQSLQLFGQARDDSRPYYMSTPRLPEPDRIDWAVPFRSDRIDELFSLDASPRPLGWIRELLGLSPADDSRLLPLLSAEPAPAPAPWQERRVRVRYCGHACVLLECGGVSVLTDPFIPVVPKEGGIPRFSFQDLPERIDFVLITHGHHDHFVFESLLRLRSRIGCLVVPRSSGMFYGDLSMKLMAERLGFRDVREIDTLDSLPFPGGEIVGAPFFGEHSDLPHAKSSYVVRFGEQRVLFAADSNCLDARSFRHLRAAVGPIATVFLGMEFVGAPLSWVYGPLLPVPPTHSHSMSRRSNGSDAASALRLLEAVGAERVYVYAIGREPWLKYFLALTPEDNDVYIQESNRVLASGREQGFKDAARPYGRMEWVLDG